MKKIKVPLGDRSYYVHIGYDILSELKKIDLSGSGAIITDSNVEKHWIEPFKNALGKDLPVYAITPGEASKSLDTARDIYTQLLKWGLDRYSFIVALGGGVVGDLAGFAAATYMRGIPCVQVPTTLMAQVDSSIGGKTAVDLPEGKNLVGAFWQPKLVVIDIKTLTTLPEKELKVGLAEVVKYGVIKDAKLFEFLEKKAEVLLDINNGIWESVITKCAGSKADIVGRDERELTGLRAILNYGHTIGHALEAVSDYKDITHGEAVAFGMIAAARLSNRLGYLSEKDMSRQINLINELKLVSLNRPGLKSDISAIVERLRYDKKAKGGRLRFVLAKKIGEVFVSDKVTEEDVRAVLEELWRM